MDAADRMTDTSVKVTAFIGLGSNLGDSIKTLSGARSELAALSETGEAVCSSFYRSAPLGLTDQPDFINAVCKIETRLAPQALLSSLLNIEQQHGRVRTTANAPRTLDLDLLLYGDQVVAGPDIEVPHPRLHERAFVLYPLLEIAPNIAIPGLGPARELVKKCGDQVIERLTGKG